MNTRAYNESGKTIMTIIMAIMMIIIILAEFQIILFV